jgi:predicted regulator of Ras-like GTPase activity (Roadblock/LC7/MglB family)
MPAPLPTIEQLLSDLAQLSGVISVALADTQLGLIKSVISPAYPDREPFTTEQRVLNEAMLSAARQLAERAQLGETKEIHQVCTLGGLLLVRIDADRWWILHHQPDSLPALFRVALREAAEKIRLVAPKPLAPEPPRWNSTPVPRLGELPKILFREQKDSSQVESSVYNSPNTV